MRHAAWSVAMLCSVVVGADEWPADTNTIVSLTVEQARRLAREFPGAVAKREFRGEEWTLEGCLPLDGVRSLDAETTNALAGYRKGPLFLNGLTTLSAGAATALAQHEGDLYLDGLATLSAEVARALARHKGDLHPGGLTTLTV